MSVTAVTAKRLFGVNASRVRACLFIADQPSSRHSRHTWHETIEENGDPHMTDPKTSPRFGPHHEDGNTIGGFASRDATPVWRSP